MNKRLLLSFVAILSLAAVQTVGAQQPKKIPRIGFLSSFSASNAAGWEQAFRQGLRDLGWTEGKNISIEYRYSEGKGERLPDSQPNSFGSKLM